MQALGSTCCRATPPAQARSSIFQQSKIDAEAGRARSFIQLGSTNCPRPRAVAVPFTWHTCVPTSEVTTSSTQSRAPGLTARGQPWRHPLLRPTSCDPWDTSPDLSGVVISPAREQPHFRLPRIWLDLGKDPYRAGLCKLRLRPPALPIVEVSKVVEKCGLSMPVANLAG